MMQKLKLQVNNDLPLREAVGGTLRQAILDGPLPPGDRLMELHLAQQLGVSRTPVREAIRLLEEEELVRVIPRHGAVVAQITIQEMEEVREVGCILEELAVRRACRHMTQERLASLSNAAAAFEEQAASGDLMAAARAAAVFHEVVGAAAGNRQLMDTLAYIRPRMFRYLLEMIKNKNSHSRLARRQRLLIEALRSADEEKAVQTVRDLFGIISSQQ